MTLNIPFGYCHCGCGQLTAIAKWNRSDRGHIKGQPMRFIRGHGARRPVTSEYTVDPSTDCWIWNRGTTQCGNETTERSSTLVIGGVRDKAYRHYFRRFKGEIPVRAVIDHTCRNPLCVNPDHLEAVTQAVNVRRGSRAKLTMEDAESIRAMYPSRTMREIADLFGVHNSTIHGIIHRKYWA